MHTSIGLSRRRFLATAAGSAATVASVSGGGTANDTLAVALIGCGSQGRNVARAMAQVPGVRLAAVCDPDESRLGKLREELGAERAVGDLRRILDDRSIDAVIVATPDHWHAPAAILACDAGKHVYVEKPCSHNLREAMLLRETAHRTGVTVQHGTQSRSNPLIADAVAMLREGAVGDLLVAKAWNVQRRKNIGHQQPSAPPPGVDYDLWVGPAPLVPFQANRFHYDWRWWHAFGCGDVGNDGTHELDYARWGLGVDSFPTRIVGLGGKYAFDDDQEFPDTAAIVFEYPGDGSVGQRRQVMFEMRLWSGTYPHNCDSGVEFHGTDGMLFVSKRGKLELLDGRNKRVEIPPRAEPAMSGSHQADFVTAIREGRRPRADMDEAVRSVALVHLGNIAVRLERAIRFEPTTGHILDDQEANALLARDYRDGHWAVPKGV